MTAVLAFPLCCVHQPAKRRICLPVQKYMFNLLLVLAYYELKLFLFKY